MFSKLKRHNKPYYVADLHCLAQIIYYCNSLNIVGELHIKKRNKFVTYEDSEKVDRQAQLKTSIFRPDFIFIITITSTQIFEIYVTEALRVFLYSPVYLSPCILHTLIKST